MKTKSWSARQKFSGRGDPWEAAGITFNSRIIFVDEVALNQLDGEARFTDATATNNDELVLSHKLSRRQTLATGVRSGGGCGQVTTRKPPTGGGDKFASPKIAG